VDPGFLERGGYFTGLKLAACAPPAKWQATMSIWQSKVIMKCQKKSNGRRKFAPPVKTKQSGRPIFFPISSPDFN